MKKETIELIKEKLQRELSDIRHEIYCNKKDINRIAKKQRALKEARNKLNEIMSNLINYLWTKDLTLLLP